MDSIRTTPATIDTNDSANHSPTQQGASWIITPLEKRLEAYKRFRTLSARGKSTHQLVITISKQLEVSQQTVYAWTKGTSPLGTSCGRITYTKELFYIIRGFAGRWLHLPLEKHISGLLARRKRILHQICAASLDVHNNEEH